MKFLALVLFFAAAGLTLSGSALAHGGDPDDEAKALKASMAKPMVMRVSGKRARLDIIHVTKGCHVWAKGKRQAAGTKLVLRRGARLTVVNKDVDAHQLVKLAGPSVKLGPKMGINDQVTVLFKKNGVYRLKSRRTEIPGIPKVPTVGVDNALAMVIVVK
jgi:hypothetical protein